MNKREALSSDSATFWSSLAAILIVLLVLLLIVALVLVVLVVALILVAALILILHQKVPPFVSSGTALFWLEQRKIFRKIIVDKCSFS